MRFFHEVITYRSSNEVEFDVENILEVLNDFLELFHGCFIYDEIIAFILYASNTFDFALLSAGAV